MAQNHVMKTRLWPVIATIALLTVSGFVPAQTPRVGEVQRLSVITIAMQVGNTEKETKQVTYSPPPGWYVRSHSVDCTKKSGNSSFTVSTVPREWTWSSESKIRDLYRTMIDGVAKTHDLGLQAELQLEQDQKLTEFHRVRASHHALVVEATARGEGFLRGTGTIELTVTAELVYVGTDEILARTATVRHRTRLR